MIVPPGLRPRRHALIAFALIAAAIAVLSLIPIEPQPEPTGGDKLQHLAAYALLIFPVALAARSALVWALPAAIGMGAALEVLQPLSGRSRELADMAANVAGLALGIAAGLIVARLWRQGTAT